MGFSPWEECEPGWYTITTTNTTKVYLSLASSGRPGYSTQFKAGEIVATISRKYNLGSLEGRSLAEARLPAPVEAAFKSKGYNTVESVYGAMVGSPDSIQKFLVPFLDSGITYEKLLCVLQNLLSTETRAKLEAPRKALRKTGVVRRRLA